MKNGVLVQRWLQRLWQREKLLLLLVVIFAFWLRLPGLTSTATDWHAFRQADTASVTREYVKHGINLLVPRYQDLSNIQSGLDNLEGYRMVEFPVINAGEALLIRSFPFLPIEATSRQVSMLFSLAALAAIYGVARQWHGRKAALFAALTFAIWPYARFYSRAILPEAPLLFFGTFSIYAFGEWLSSRKPSWYLASLLSLMLAGLLKPFVFFWLPVFGWLTLQKYGKHIWKQWPEMLFPVLSLLPLVWWRHWIEQFPSGIPDNKALFNGDGIRLRPAWFRWLFWERLTKLIFGGFSWIGFLIGLLPLHRNWPADVIWWSCCLLYMVVIATGNVRHDYYQVILLPCLSVVAGAGLAEVFVWLHRKVAWGAAVLAVGAILWLSSVVAWQFVGGFYGTRADYETAGAAADALLPADAKVIAPAFGDTIFLFQTNRTGWPIGFEIPDKIQKGAQFYVTTSYDDEARMLEKQYPTMAKTPNYLIFDLRTPLKP